MDFSIGWLYVFAVIGGLVTSTVLSLLVVPVVFTYVDDVEHWSKRQIGRLRRREPAGAPLQSPPAADS